MRREDFVGPPCHCPECRQADMDGKEPRRDPRTGEMLHGYQLRAWYEARSGFLALRQQIQPKGMP